MKFVVEFDPTSDRTSTVPGTSYQERACFRVQVGDSWSSPVTPSELAAICQTGAARKVTEIDPATALITSAFFNFDKAEARRAGDTAQLRRPSESSGETRGFKAAGDVVKRYHPSTEALKKMGYKSLSDYLRRKNLLPKGEETTPRQKSEAAKLREQIVADLHLDFSHLNLNQL